MPEPKTEPWAWAVVDPNERLRDQEGDRVSRLICWDPDDADHFLDCAREGLEAGDEQPSIVPLYPRDLALVKEVLKLRLKVAMMESLIHAQCHSIVDLSIEKGKI